MAQSLRTYLETEVDPVLQPIILELTKEKPRGAEAIKAAIARLVAEAPAKILLLPTNVPSYELLAKAANPSVTVVTFDYDADKDNAKSDADMQMMAGQMMAAMGTVYTHVGFVDVGGYKGFSSLIGHFVPRDMFENDPTQAPNFVWLQNMLVDVYLNGRQPKPEPNFAVNPCAGNPKKGQIDYLTCAGMGVEGLRKLRSDTTYTTGRGSQGIYFESAGFDKWVKAVTAAGESLVELGWDP